MAPRKPISSVVEATHARACAAGHDFYIDPETGLMVMTALYLRDRGFCCDNGCRHCPWGEEEATA